MKNRISKLNIEFDEIGTENKSSVQVIVPTFVADKVINVALDWKHHWSGEVMEVERLLEAIENYKKNKNDS